MTMAKGVRRNDICAVQIAESGGRSASRTGGSLVLGCVDGRQGH